jgi:lipid-A-disaccharide synthase-like uncharacterized protein
MLSFFPTQQKLLNSSMDWLSNLLWHNGRLLGIEWGVWKVIGWAGNAVFFSRFIVQWYATEKLKRVVVPAAFWWLSLAGSLLLLSYALFYKGDSVFIFAYAFTWIPYIRNLIIHHRHEDAHLDCPGCQTTCPPASKYCSECGSRLTAEVAKAV